MTIVSMVSAVAAASLVACLPVYRLIVLKNNFGNGGFKKWFLWWMLAIVWLGDAVFVAGYSAYSCEKIFQNPPPTKLPDERGGNWFLCQILLYFIPSIITLVVAQIRETRRKKNLSTNHH